ncbi:protein of unknown function [Vibrio tapetis subsp. tapetis]|uniref:Uncharacterized protein n=1 Tax=Vibrio tapetis subsp. tapetis TaxID=1671868 RepID=A0A2N8ZBJ4_9VIBR|nr:protein of unknown function [Vibrio tapetis subsp. tapetis]
MNKSIIKAESIGENVALAMMVESLALHLRIIEMCMTRSFLCQIYEVSVNVYVSD